jgi:hypothetical protein
MLSLMPYWAIEGQPSDFPLAHQQIALALDAYAREREAAVWEEAQQIVRTEIELDGSVPAAVFIEGSTPEGMERVCRATVRATKNSILERLCARADKARRTP